MSREKVTAKHNGQSLLEIGRGVNFMVLPFLKKFV
jgi:hypothetical protein